MFDVFVSIFVMSYGRDESAVDGVRVRECLRYPVNRVDRIALRKDKSCGVGIRSTSVLGVGCSRGALAVGPVAGNVAGVSICSGVAGGVTGDAIGVASTCYAFRINGPIHPPFSSAMCVCVICGDAGSLCVFSGGFGLVRGKRCLFRGAGRGCDLAFSFGGVCGKIGRLRLSLGGGGPTLLGGLRSLLIGRALTRSAYGTEDRGPVMLGTGGGRGGVMCCLVLGGGEVPCCFLGW